MTVFLIADDSLSGVFNRLTGKIVNFTGGSAADLTDGSSDQVTGGSARDTIIGGSGGGDPVPDSYNGAGGDDLIGVATAGAFLLDGGDGIDTVSFRPLDRAPDIGTSIRLNLQTGATDIGVTALHFENAFLGEGNDRVVGSGSANTIFGGRGYDTLFGMGGNDRLFGGPGKDFLAGGKGDDYLRGGFSGDIYIFAPDGGADLVIGYKSGTDFIDVHAFGFASRAEALSHATQSGGDTILDLGQGTTVTLVNVTSLAEFDFTI